MGTRYTYNIQFYPNGHSIQMPPTPGSVPRVAFDFRGLTAWAALEYYGGLLGWNYCTAFRARRVRLSSGRSAIDLGPDCEIFSLGFRPRVTGRHSFTVQMYQVEVQGGRYRVVGAPRGGVAGWQGLIEP